MLWFNYVENLKIFLSSLSVHTGDGELEKDGALNLWFEKTNLVRRHQRTVFLIGNGASASMASHVAADLSKNADVNTEVFSDISLLSAIANDIGYEEVFAEPLRRRMKAGDMLVVISSSGQSPNVLRAVQEARQRGGFIVTLSAMSSENKLRGLGDINIYVPAQTYGMAETCHAAILHYWIDQMVGILNNPGMDKGENE